MIQLAPSGPRSSRMIFSTALLWSLTTLLASPTWAATRTVAATGLPAPGTSIAFDSLSLSASPFVWPWLPALNDSGKTVFAATLAGAGVTSANNRGIWSDGGGSLALVARTGDLAPGASAVPIPPLGDPPGSAVSGRFSDLQQPVLNGVGQVQFAGRVGFPVPVQNAGERGIWSNAPGVLSLLAFQGNNAPGTPSGTSYDEFLSHSLNEAGRVALAATLAGAGGPFGDAGIWAEHGVALDPVVRAGDQAPGLPAGVNFGANIGQFPAYAQNSAGLIAFAAALQGSGVNGTNAQSLWSADSIALTLIARQGSPAPGMPAGANFNSFSPPRLNDAGRIAFIADTTGGGLDAAHDEGIWLTGPGGPSLVLGAGTQAPGTPAGVLFGRNDGAFGIVELNDAGQIAFTAGLSGIGVNEGNDFGIWAQRPGGFALIALEGSPAPWSAPGPMFFQFSSFAFNDAGQVAFSAELAGAGIFNTGLWATDRTGALILIAREGDVLEVAPNDFRTIQFLDVETGTDNSQMRQMSGLNNLGEIAFLAQFTDGSSGIFVSDLAALPEPGAAALTVAGLVGLVKKCRGRRRRSTPLC